ncbi:hypothetical protein VULLAG_LOCUS23262 [Vulpes lagopus]
MIIIPILQIRETEARSRGVSCRRRGRHSLRVVELGLIPWGTDPQSPRFQGLQDKGCWARPAPRAGSLKRPSSRAAGEAEGAGSPLALNPGPGQRLPWGRRVEAGGARAPRGAVPGSSPPPPAPRGAAPGAAVALASASGAGAGETTGPPPRASRPEPDPPRSRTYLQFICVNYLLSLAASPAAAPPPLVQEVQMSDLPGKPVPSSCKKCKCQTSRARAGAPRLLPPSPGTRVRRSVRVRDPERALRTECSQQSSRAGSRAVIPVSPVKPPEAGGFAEPALSVLRRSQKDGQSESSSHSLTAPERAAELPPGPRASPQHRQ